MCRLCADRVADFQCSGTTSSVAFSRRPAEAISKPDRINAAPSSWSGEGLSSTSSAAKQTARSGCSVRSTDVRAVGSRPSETVIRSQPSTCELSASVISQPWASSAGREVEVAEDEADRDDADRAGERRVVERAGNPAPLAGSPAQREQEARVRDPGEQAVDRAELRVAPVRPALEHSGDEDDPDHRDRDREQRVPGRALAKDRPRQEADEHDLRVAENGREAGAHVLDRVVPEDEVGREEDAADPGRAAQRPRDVRRFAGPPRRRAASRNGSAQKQRKKAPVVGETCDLRKRIPEKAIVTAPRSTPSAGRWVSARRTPRA